MAKFSLSTYILRIKDGFDQYCNDADIDPKKSFIDIFSGYLQERESNWSHDAENKKVLQVRNYNPITLHTINGIIETGEYGFESELRDKDTTEISYMRASSDAEMLPFYFLLHSNGGNNGYIMVLQRFKQLGIKKILLDDFQRYFKGQYPNLSIEINNLVPEDIFIKNLEGARITKVHFRRFLVPKDVSDEYEMGAEEKLGFVELSYIAQRNQSLSDKVNKYLPSIISKEPCGGDIIELFNVRDKIGSCDSIKLEVKIGKNQRTIDINNPLKMRPYLDISDQVKLNQNGHPSFESIDRISQDLLKDIKDSMLLGEN